MNNCISDVPYTGEAILVYERPILEGSYTGEAVLVYERLILEGSYTAEAVLVYERGRSYKKRPSGVTRRCFVISAAVVPGLPQAKGR